MKYNYILARNKGTCLTEKLHCCCPLPGGHERTERFSRLRAPGVKSQVTIPGSLLPCWALQGAWSQAAITLSLRAASRMHHCQCETQVCLGFSFLHISNSYPKLFHSTGLLQWCVHRGCWTTHNTLLHGKWLWCEKHSVSTQHFRQKNHFSAVRQRKERAIRRVGPAQFWFWLENYLPEDLHFLTGDITEKSNKVSSPPSWSSVTVTKKTPECSRARRGEGRQAVG